MEILEQLTLNQSAQILGLKKSQVANLRANTRELSTLEYLQLKQFQADQELLFFNWQENDLIFWNHIEQLQELLKYSDQSMSEMFSIQLRSFRFSRSRTKSLPWSCSNYFNARFKFHPVMWFSPDADIECLAKNISSPFKSNAYLPKIFEGGGSKNRTLINAIQYISEAFGPNYARALTYSLQITPESLTFAEKDISLRVFALIHKKLRAFGAIDEHYINMGSFNRMNERNRRMFTQQVPSNIKMLHEILDFFVKNMINKVDRNKMFKIESINKNPKSLLP